MLYTPKRYVHGVGQVDPSTTQTANDLLNISQNAIPQAQQLYNLANYGSTTFNPYQYAMQQAQMSYSYLTSNNTTMWVVGGVAVLVGLWFVFGRGK